MVAARIRGLKSLAGPGKSIKPLPARKQRRGEQIAVPHDEDDVQTPSFNKKTPLGEDSFQTVFCPRCESPMSVRMNRHGPYFHCQCVQRSRC